MLTQVEFCASPLRIILVVFFATNSTNIQRSIQNCVHVITECSQKGIFSTRLQPRSGLTPRNVPRMHSNGDYMLFSQHCLSRFDNMNMLLVFCYSSLCLVRIVSATISIIISLLSSLCRGSATITTQLLESGLCSAIEHVLYRFVFIFIRSN